MHDETPAAVPSEDRHWLHEGRMRFRGWRGSRPFWAGLFTIIGGLPIAYFPYADVKIGQMTVRMATTAGAGALIIGVLLVTLGLTMWFHHVVRVFAGVAAIVLALVSIPISNLGGFIVGYLFSLIGGGMAIAWAPGGAKPGGDPAEPEAGDPDTEPEGQGDVPTAAPDFIPGFDDPIRDPGPGRLSGRTLGADDLPGRTLGADDDQPGRTLDVSGGPYRV
jgi:Family of unknown function (DUF6114)